MQQGLGILSVRPLEGLFVVQLLFVNVLVVLLLYVSFCHTLLSYHATSSCLFILLFCH